jgi:glycerol-1-phosphate dehydrogenase [NAD(P)+]
MNETLWNLPRIEIGAISAVKENRPTAVLTGNRAWDAVGSLLNLPIVVQAEPHTADINFLESLANSLPEHVEVIYGIGGGLTCDVAKYVGWKAQKPVVIIPTALSVDGFFTALVAARENGSVTYYTTGPAEKVIVDFDVVASAPAHIRGTGIVEILTMTTGLLDWKYAAERKKNTPAERFQMWAANIAAAIAQHAYKIAQGVGDGKHESLRNLLDLICVEVQLTNQLGHNRPQEGSEQYFAYAIEPRVARGRSVPYADLVGPGILIAAALHNQNVTPIRETLESAGVRLGQLRRDDIVATLKQFPQYAHDHNLPYGILHEHAMTDDAIQTILAKTGL